MNNVPYKYAAGTIYQVETMSVKLHPIASFRSVFSTGFLTTIIAGLSILWEISSRFKNPHEYLKAIKTRKSVKMKALRMVYKQLPTILDPRQIAVAQNCT